MSTQRITLDDGFPSDLVVELHVVTGRAVRSRLEHGIRSAIQQGRLPGGTVLPPSRVLAGDLGLSRGVVVEAYRNLVADGYLEARRGAWTRVRRVPAEAARRHDQARTYEEEAFFGWRRPTDGKPRIRLFGGLPDPTLFPARLWMRHYRAAMGTLPYSGLTYPDILGAESLRVALSAYLGRSRGVATSPEHILVCSGFMQGLSLICRALGRAGARRIAVEEPCFAWHRAAIAMAGLEPVPVRVDADGLDVARLETEKVDAVLVAPAHSYPSGATLVADRRHALVTWARRVRALIIEDDYDAEFRYDRAPIGALQGLAPESVLFVGSASKILTPALRLGWIAAPLGVLDALAREKHFADMGSALPSQIALARFVESGDLARHLRRVRPVYRDRRDAATAAIAKRLPGASWSGAAAGLHLHLVLPEGVDEAALVRAAYKRGVHFEAGAWHWSAPEEAPPSIVLGYGAASEPTIRRAIATLADEMALADQP